MVKSEWLFSGCFGVDELPRPRPVGRLLPVDRGQQPVINLLRFHCAGVGEIAPVRREVLRKAEPIRSLRPYVHVG